MKLYRKKPVVVQAWQFTKENFKNGVPQWIKQSTRNITLWSQYGGEIIEGEIHTLEGTHQVIENDWIIKGVKGKLYPCKPDIFKETYEEVFCGDDVKIAPIQEDLLSADVISEGDLNCFNQITFDEYLGREDSEV